MSASVPTFYDILLGVYQDLGQLVHGTATGGSATTCVDSGLSGKDGDWKQGTLFMTYDAAGNGVAPEGEYAEITAYARSSGTLTYATGALTANPAEGDHYAVASKRWTLEDMKNIVNRALVRMGDIPVVDTSLTTVINQLEYTLPAGARRGTNLRRVYMDQYSTSNATEPREITRWRPEGSSLIFRNELEAGKTLTLVYMAPHSVLTAYDSALSPYVPLNRAIAEAVHAAFSAQMRATDGTDRQAVRDINAAAADLELARQQYPVWDPGTPFKSLLQGKQQGMRSSKYGPWVT